MKRKENIDSEGKKHIDQKESIKIIILVIKKIMMNLILILNYIIKSSIKFKICPT